MILVTLPDRLAATIYLLQRRGFTPRRIPNPPHIKPACGVCLLLPIEQQAAADAILRESPAMHYSWRAEFVDLRASSGA
jgi:hypothetical protein